MVFRSRRLLAAMVATFYAFTGIAQACTGILLRNADGSVVHGRTVEFGVAIEVNLVVIPKGHQFTGTVPGGAGLRYEAKHAIVGMVAYKDIVVADGMNDQGLAAGAFYFPTFAGYADITDANRARAVSPMEFTNWALARFGTVAEVKTAIAAGEIVIAPTVLDGWGPTAPPLHYIVYDRTGASIVVEPVKGELVVHDNPLGIITNAPDFAWHMTNLRNYIALSPENAAPATLAGVKLAPLGQGTGMLGIPGDFTPPARFVRAAAFTTTAVPSPDAEEGVKQVFHILNNFDIPIGLARDTSGDKVAYDYTQMTVARDPQKLRYYWRTYDDQTLRMVDMKAPGIVDAKTVLMLTTEGLQPVVDMSGALAGR